MVTDPGLIAIIEGDKALSTALARVLRVSGFATAVYTLAEDFLISPPPMRARCVVADVELSGMSGIDLQRRLDALASALPLILVGNFDDASLRQEAEQSGCFACVDASDDIQVLLDLIHRLPQPQP